MKSKPTRFGPRGERGPSSAATARGPAPELTHAERVRAIAERAIAAMEAVDVSRLSPDSAFRHFYHAVLLERYVWEMTARGA